MHLIMFDIDGTLVDSNHFDDRLFAEAIGEVLDIHINGNWEQFIHATDSGILDQIIEENDFSASSDQIHDEVKQHFIQLTENHLAQNTLSEIPGAAQLIQSLQARDDLKLAIATGGWEETARMKLHAVGINPDSFAFASCSDAPARTEIMEIAEQRALNHISPLSRVYFGDGSWDKKACEELNYRFIAVGERVEHRVRIDDFKDTEGVISLLTSVRDKK
ncbi:HAD family hydrolase [Gracilimonas mengyeensis]|uniref:Phosphoglycolate phosphatase, HAD superfamily n=1 Tax=Gracilimonas mengyeensis TaxID=1302730 RepID=A0A521ELT3_9BACT|nr:HAD hydrolase-like protein [Gracilimonas mengyeensis]SMO84862.1 Phosphoglycolate phosphatase, HAD superfamily [Gracilimonas mengyeensis]